LEKCAEKCAFWLLRWQVDLYAPGVDVPGPAKGGGYTTISGTSASAALAAGVAAVFLGHRHTLGAPMVGDSKEVKDALQVRAPLLGLPASRSVCCPHTHHACSP
jgi:subtilisin family serine protease